MEEPLLSLENVVTYYGQMRILEGISLRVGAGELVCLLGGNASGKSTTLKTILGIVRPRSGTITLNGWDVTGWPVPQRIAGGLAIVPENRRLFGEMTVRENLELGAVLQDRSTLADDLERVHTLFPRLHERRDQLAGTHVRRRAADGGDGPGADVSTEAAADGRALDGSWRRRSCSRTSGSSRRYTTRASRC